MTREEKAARSALYMEMRLAGAKLKDIAREFEVSVQAVSATLRYHTDPNRRRLISAKSTKRTKAKYHSDPDVRAEFLARSKQSRENRK